MAVVCAGPKAILDVPATLEYLETRGVPVVAIGQAELPGFYAREPASRRRRRVADVAARGAARRRPPRPRARQRDPRLRAGARGRGARRRTSPATPIERAIAEAEAAGIAGPELTPWLLARIAEITDGASVRANTALIVNNARVAGRAGRRARAA